MKIYTKTGDSGQTSLYGGNRVSKADLQIEAYGVLDELNVYIGYIRSKKELKSQGEVLKEIQDRIFSIGAYLASDFTKEQLFKPELKPTDIELLENQIDAMDAELPPLKYFVLPGGHDVVSLTHLARVVTRRAERAIVCFYNSLEKTPVEKDFILQYVNRLSDYLFVLSRFVAKETKTTEYHWKPRVS